MDANATQSNSVYHTFQQEIADLPYLDMGTGFLIGMAVGYFVKKSFLMVLLLAGAVIALLFGLEQIHILHIDQQQLQSTVAEGSNWLKTAYLSLKERVSQFGKAGSGSAAVGFFVGLKMG